MNIIKAGALAIGLLLGGTIAATATATAQPDLRPWDYSQTRSAGHYAVVGDDLHIWTDDATSNAKVAGYHPYRSTMAVVGTSIPTLTWLGTTPAPGLQVVINIAGKDRILVGETVYGVNWWMSDSGCDTWCDTLDIDWQGGGGSAHSAPLSEWGKAIPTAAVTAFGFSLGSGVHGDGTITDLQFMGKSWTFKPFTPPTKTKVTYPPTSKTPTTTSSRPSEPTDPPIPTLGGPITTTTATVFYADCDAARAAGVAPLAASAPGYRAGLDSDSDGTACEETTVAVTHTGTPRRAASDTEDLAYTGTPSALPWFVVGGAGLVFAGVGALVLAVRRKRGEHR